MPHSSRIWLVIAGATLASTLLWVFSPVGTLAESEPESAVAEKTEAAGFYTLTSRTLEGEEVALATWQGQVALVVNVASKCGLTPQYAGLEKLYRELAPQGFVVLGFPSNDFRNQEPGTPAEIRSFCTTNYEVTFPLFEKMVVTGEQKSEIYAFLTREQKEPSWNFTKYLVGRDGQVLARFEPGTAPDDPELRGAIMKELGSSESN